MENLFGKKAQGTIEYLLIIAIIIVIALVVVGLLGGFFTTADQVNESQTKIYWAAQPLGIIDGIADADGNAIFVVQYNEPDYITFNTMMIDGTDFSVEDGSSQVLWQGDKYSMQVSGVEACNSIKKAYLISMSYTTKHSIDKNVSANDFIVTCVPEISVASSGSSTTSFDSAGSAAGAFLIYDGSDFVDSGTDTNRIILPLDTNTMCFNGVVCDVNIDWNGTDLVIQMPE